MIFISILIQLTKGDSFSENERHKRTIGFLFRELAKAFQSPQQPAPTVTSFQPQRPMKQKKRPPNPTKSDNPPPNSPRPEKVVLQTAVTTESTEVQLLPLESPITADPLQDTPTPNHSIFIPPQSNFPSHAPENDQQTPLFAPADPFAKMIPPPGHHPLMPLKAQIFFIPFQNRQELVNAMPKNSEPRFNYEAEKYFQAPQNTIYPLTNNYPARYSASSGWHDVDEIISRTTQKGSKHSNAPVENLTNPDYHQLNYQHLEGLSPQTDSKLGTLATNVPSQHGQEDYAPPIRRIDHNIGQKQLIENPSFIPYQEYFGNWERYFYHPQETNQREDNFQYQYLQSPQQETGYLQQEVNPYVNIQSRGHDYSPQRSKPEEQSYDTGYQQDSTYRRNAIVQTPYKYKDQISYEHYPTKIGRLPEYFT